MPGKRGGPHCGPRARVLGWAPCNTSLLTAMKRFSVLNETAACTEAFFMSWQVSQEQSTFVGSKSLPVLIWAFHSAVAGDNWVFNVPREVPHFGFWSEQGLGFGLAWVIHFQNVTEISVNKSDAGCFHLLPIITSPGDRVWANKAACMKDVYGSHSKTKLEEER